MSTLEAPSTQRTASSNQNVRHQKTPNQKMPDQNVANGQATEGESIWATRWCANAIGWFSIGLGTAEFLAPRVAARLMGIHQHRNLVQLCGLREIISGVGILRAEQPAGWLWSRVAGDIVDLGTLLGALPSVRTDTGRAFLGISGVLAVGLIDLTSSIHQSRASGTTA